MGKAFEIVFVAMHRLVAWLLLPVIVVVVTAEVVARYLLRTPLPWSEDVVTSALLLTFVLAIPYCALKRIHVRVETVYEWFAPPARRLADRLSGLCGFVFLGALAVGAFRESIGMYRRGDESEFAAIPQWPLAAAVALVATACGLYCLLQVIRPETPAGTAGERDAGPSP